MDVNDQLKNVIVMIANINSVVGYVLSKCVNNEKN